jgi:hypothetical protein
MIWGTAKASQETLLKLSESAFLGFRVVLAKSFPPLKERDKNNIFLQFQ